MNETIELLKDIVQGFFKTIGILKSQGKTAEKIEKKLEDFPTAEVLEKHHQEQLQTLKTLKPPTHLTVTIDDPVKKVSLDGKVDLSDASVRSFSMIVVTALKPAFSAIAKAIGGMKVIFPRGPRDPVSVRLSNGDQFYVAGGSGGASGIQTSPEFQTNHVDSFTTGSVTYIGKENAVGGWMIKKIDESGDIQVFTYATIENNPELASYGDAWAVRATTLIYGTYSEAS